MQPATPVTLMQFAIPAADFSDPALACRLCDVGRDLVEAALSGAGDVDLVAVLGGSLNRAGFDLSRIDVACDAVDPERADHFIGWRHDDAARSHAILSGEVFDSMQREDTTTASGSARKMIRFAALLREGATDAIALVDHLAPEVTLGFFDDVMSLFATERPSGLSGAEIDFLKRVTPLFALALGARLNAAAARVLLRTYLGGDAATALLDGRVGLGQVAKIRAIVIYCDMLDFTSTTEKLDAECLVDRLNTFFETITRPVSVAGGQVAGHVGDAVVMFFPLPDAESERRLCATAVRTAREGLAELVRSNATRDSNPAGPIRARIGIDRGDVIHGNIGSAGRFSFTIIGTPVNRAARLQALAKDLGASLLMTADFAEAAAVQCSGFGSHTLKGLAEPAQLVGDRAGDGTADLQTQL